MGKNWKNLKPCHTQGKKVSLASLTMTMWGLVRSALAPLHTEDTSNVFKEEEHMTQLLQLPKISLLTSQIRPNKEEELPLSRKFHHLPRSNPCPFISPYWGLHLGRNTYRELFPRKLAIKTACVDMLLRP